MSIAALRRKFIGSRAFYRMVLAVVVPIMIQNGITNFVSLLDNVMVGRTTEEQYAGVTIVNQLLFVYNLCIFGGLSGAGIFTAQFFGRKDMDGVRATFRYKLGLAFLLTAGAATLFLTAGPQLIGLYLRGSGDAPEKIRLTLDSGLRYLQVMLLGLPPFMAVQVYTSTLRECSETLLPMKAGIAAVLVNLALNWVLIFGHLGFPAMGVTGAAAATAVSRYVEAAIVIGWTHTHRQRCPWTEGLYRRLTVPLTQLKAFFVRGFPLLFNEALWSGGMAVVSQCYSERGLDAVNAANISSTIGNLFMIVFISMGSAVAIIVGQRLGAGRMEEAKDTDTKLIAFSVFLAVATGAVMFLVCPLFPQMYNVSGRAMAAAAAMMRVNACFMPVHAFLNAAYFTIRSGGRTWITFFFDCGFTWAVSVPVAFCLSRFTGLDVVWMFALVSAADLIKCVIGLRMVHGNLWMNSFAAGAQAPAEN